MVLWVLLLPRGKFGNKGRRKTMGSPWIRIQFYFFGGGEKNPFTNNLLSEKSSRNNE